MWYDGFFLVFQFLTFGAIFLMEISKDPPCGRGFQVRSK